MPATGTPPNPANIFDPSNQAWLASATPAQVSAYSKQDDLTFARADAQNDLTNIEHAGGVFSNTLNGEVGTFGVLESTTDYLNEILKESGVDTSGYYDSAGFVGASPNSGASTSDHPQLTTRSLRPPASPNDTNPATQLPISGRPVLTVAVDGSGGGGGGGGGGTGGGGGGTGGGGGGGTGGGDTGGGTGGTSDQSILSQLIALAAAQNSGGGGSGAGGLVALPTGIADSSTVAAPAATSHTGAILLILLISGLAFWYYKKHKKAA